MTASLQPESNSTSRRALLAGALGGVGAWAASAIGRASPVRAGVDGDVVLGSDNIAATTTKITNTANTNGVFWAQSTAGGIALSGSSNSSTGIVGASTTGIGVAGATQSATNSGVVGTSYANGTGVLGASTGGASPPAAKAKTGVYGYAAQDASAVGVFGETLTGRAVQGVATSGLGVRAYATSGTGLYASATTGVALKATGRLVLDNCSGLATIAAGTSSVMVTPGIDLVAGSAAVATVQGNPAGSAVVKAVEVNATTNKLTIRLTANASATLKVAWHVFG